MTDVKDAPNRPAAKPVWDQDRPRRDESRSAGTSGWLSGMIGSDWLIYFGVAAVAVAIGIVNAFLGHFGIGPIAFFGDEIISCEIPASVELEITETEPGIQGDRVSGARKPATLETGLVVQVPLFVGPGEKIKVDTRTGEYLARA